MELKSPRWLPGLIYRICRRRRLHLSRRFTLPPIQGRPGPGLTRPLLKHTLTQTLSSRSVHPMRATSQRGIRVGFSSQPTGEKLGSRPELRFVLGGASLFVGWKEAGRCDESGLDLHTANPHAAPSATITAPAINQSGWQQLCPVVGCAFDWHRPPANRGSDYCELGECTRLSGVQFGDPSIRSARSNVSGPSLLSA